VTEVVKTYRVASGEVRALRGVSAEFRPGAVSAVVGPSGSGKSTLLRLLAGIDRRTSGHVRVLEVDVDRAGARARRHLRHDRVGYLFQRPSDNLFPHLTLAEHLRLARAGRRADADDAREVVATLGSGASFGEVALVDKSARSATVTATSPVRAYGLPVWSFRSFAEARPVVLWKLLELLAERLRAAEHR